MKKRATSTILDDFSVYLKLERSLSENTIKAYCSDVMNLLNYSSEDKWSSGLFSFDKITDITLLSFIAALNSKNLSKRSQARVISSIKSFFTFLELEGKISSNPSEALETPKIGRYLPAVLSQSEVNKILTSVDLSLPEGHRNRAMLEMLYSCGLRVSELVNIKISDLFLKEGFIRVSGKGEKERIVPIGEPAIDALKHYLTGRRCGVIKPKHDDTLFLNRRGGKLSREMVFLIVKKTAVNAGIEKDVSPHTFRHSFATHMVENGADLRVVQQMLGHESILTTEIYTHVNSQKWRESVLKFHPTKRNKL